MSILYNGDIRTMPPKLLTDDKRHIVIRPMALCQEADIVEYAKALEFPIIPCNLCGTQENLKRQFVSELIADLAKENRNVPSNILHAISQVRPSQLMDKKLWNFKDLEQQRVDEEGAVELEDSSSG